MGRPTQIRIAALLLAVLAPASLVLAHPVALPPARPALASVVAADERAPRADMVLHGWRVAPPDVIAREAPSQRSCRPRLASAGTIVCGGEVVARTVQTEAAQITRMRWDRPAFPIDAAAHRVRAGVVGGAPAILVEPVTTGAGLAEVLVLFDATFDPDAHVLHVAAPAMSLADAIRLVEGIPVPRPDDVVPLSSPTPPPPVEAELRMLPPSGSSRAKLTDDWHCSAVSGDRCPRARRRTCAPGDHGHSSCSALDWNDGTPNAGERVWFRAIGTRAGAAATVRVDVTSYTATCQVLQATIVEADVALGALKYQHASRTRATLDAALDEDGALTAVAIGRTVNERRLNPNCPWTGYHVHEDDGTSRRWVAWNARRFRGAAGAHFRVDDPRNWIRALRWESAAA